MRVKTLGMYSESGGLPHLHTPISSTGVLQVRFFRKDGCKPKIVWTMLILHCCLDTAWPRYSNASWMPIFKLKAEVNGKGPIVPFATELAL